MKLSEMVDLSIALEAVPAQSAGFSVPLLLGDFPEVPVDKRYRIITRSDYATVMDTTDAAQDWATSLWGQSYNIAQAYVGRWVSEDIAPRYVLGDWNDTVADWTGVTVGDFAITDGTTVEQLATGSFAAATTGANIASVIQVAIRASAEFDSDLSAAAVSIDPLGRLYIETADTGADATTYSIIAPTGGAGTDITASGFLNVASGAFVVAGMDAEDPDDALAAILAKDDTAYVIHEIGASIAQQQSLAAACAVYKKLLVLNVRDEDAKDADATTDIAYLLSNANNSYSYGVYTEHSDQYPSAAINGAILPRPEGSAAVANNALSGVYKSGLDSDGSTVKNLSATERSALDGKSCDYLVAPVSAVHCRNGLTFAGIEVKHRIGYNWAEKRSSEEIYAYLLANEVTFSDTDIQAISGIIFKYLDILVDRKCATSFSISVPSAADISLIEQATHTLSLMDVAAIISAYAVNSVVATATATA